MNSDKVRVSKMLAMSLAFAHEHKNILSLDVFSQRPSPVYIPRRSKKHKKNKRNR
jgi:hypothetical protein